MIIVLDTRCGQTGRTSLQPCIPYSTVPL